MVIKGMVQSHGHGVPPRAPKVTTAMPMVLVRMLSSEVEVYEGRGECSAVYVAKLTMALLMAHTATGQATVSEHCHYPVGGNVDEVRYTPRRIANESLWMSMSLCGRRSSLRWPKVSALEPQHGKNVQCSAIQCANIISRTLVIGSTGGILILMVQRYHPAKGEAHAWDTTPQRMRLMPLEHALRPQAKTRSRELRAVENDIPTAGRASG